MKLFKEKKKPTKTSDRESALKNYGATISGGNQFHFLKTELHAFSGLGSMDGPLC